MRSREKTEERREIKDGRGKRNQEGRWKKIT
jgi:hypothetical protein